MRDGSITDNEVFCKHYQDMMQWLHVECVNILAPSKKRYLCCLFGSHGSEHVAVVGETIE